jgi:hypothetical protein
VLTVEDGEIIQTTQGVGSPGGLVKLYFSVTETGPWFLGDSTVFESPKNWGATGDYDPDFYACTEVGNGITYEGQSPLSNVIEIV